MKKGMGLAGIGIFVIGNGYTHTVLRLTVQTGESAVDKLTLETENLLHGFFPNL